jgi:probable HAF family extracellular repeat protein
MKMNYLMIVSLVSITVVTIFPNAFSQTENKSKSALSLAVANAKAPEIEISELGPGECYGVSTDGHIVGVEKAGGFVIDAHGQRKSLDKFKGKDSTIPYAINNAGDIVGESMSGMMLNPTRHAVIYRKGQWSDLGLLPNGNFSVALDVNESGWVVGIVGVPAKKDHFPELRGFWFANGVMKDLGTPRQSSAYRIADNGSVIGILETEDGSTHAMLVADNKITDLGTLGGKDSAAYAVNINNEIVGVADTANNSHHAFLYRNGTMLDLGTLGGDRSDAKGIDDAGLIVGNSLDAKGAGRPFLYRDGMMVDLLPKDAKGPYVMARVLNIKNGVAVGWGLPAESAGAQCLRWKIK